MANPSEHEPPKFLTPSIRLNSFPLADERTDRQSIDATLDQSSDDEPQRLERRLRRRAVSHADPNTGQSFWGYALLKDIMTRERVVEELLSAKKLSLSRSEAERLCQQIVPPSFTPENHHRRPEQPAYLAIFALLVLARRTRDVQDFLIPDFSDGRIISANLPLIGTPIIDRCRWKDTQFDTYDKHRRGVLVPYFDTGTGTIVEVSPHQELPEGTLLPWLKDKDEGGGTHRVKTGGYGSVTTYRIDPDSHSFWRLLNPVGLHSELVAVKCLNPSKHPDLVAFHKEVAMLKLYGAEARQNATKPDDRAHQHIITLLATYQQGDNYCFVFPAADCDLDDYIRKKPGLLELPQDSPGSAINAGTARWLSEQIVGLVAAVNLMHGDNPDRLTANPKFTRHGDLKLENILWFRSKTNKNGIFVVGDLGLADIHGENSRSNVANENLPVTMTYRAPECDIKGANISRAYDIWTLGCVFLEIIAWALGGNAQRVKFSRERIKTSQFARTNMYFDIIKRKEDGKFAFRVKKVVTESIAGLHKLRGCTPYIHALLDVISTKMLRVKPTDRKPAVELLAELERMHQKGGTEPRYLTDSKPEQRNLGLDDGDEWVVSALNPQIKKTWEEAIKLALNVMSTADSEESGDSVQAMVRQAKTGEAIEAGPGSSEPAHVSIVKQTNAATATDAEAKSVGLAHEAPARQTKTVQALEPVKVETESDSAYESLARQPSEAEQSVFRMWLLFIFWRAVGLILG